MPVVQNANAPQRDSKHHIEKDKEGRRLHPEEYFRKHGTVGQECEEIHGFPVFPFEVLIAVRAAGFHPLRLIPPGFLRYEHLCRSPEVLVARRTCISTACLPVRALRVRRIAHLAHRARAIERSGALSAFQYFVLHGCHALRSRFAYRCARMEQVNSWIW